MEQTSWDAVRTEHGASNTGENIDTSSMKGIRFPDALLKMLSEVCVPITDEGEAWISASLKGGGMHKDLARQAQTRALRKRAVSEVYGRSKKGRYVAPSALGYELPTAGWPEIAFAGRSNVGEEPESFELSMDSLVLVGKSTLVGTILGDPKLCRRSKMPGCTTTINFFEAGGMTGCYFVDLPGFGYAKRSVDQQLQWKEAMFGYLSTRDRLILRHACLLVDARHGLSANAKDIDALQALSELNISHHIVLVKADLARPSDIAASLADTFRTLRQYNARSTCLPIVHLVSSKRHFGIQHLRDYLASMIVESADMRRECRRQLQLDTYDDTEVE